MHHDNQLTEGVHPFVYRHNVSTWSVRSPRAGLLVVVRSIPNIGRTIREATMGILSLTACSPSIHTTRIPAWFAGNFAVYAVSCSILGDTRSLHIVLRSLVFVLR
jgi:hypothetical protein